MNAVLNSNGDLKGTSIYCTLFPCAECTKVIIQAGIKNVYCPRLKHGNDVMYRNKASELMLNAASVKIHFV